MGGARELDGAKVRYLAAGAGLVRFLDLFAGDRVLVLASRIDVVLGARERIPYVDLPALGGLLGLRGYPRDRFRDRGAATATVEYRYGVTPSVTARTFVDVGQTFDPVDDPSLDELRTGFGGGLLLHTRSALVGGFDVAGSADGDLMVVVTWGQAP
jgi:outer membrane translocation and assembly module TamA